MAFYVSNLFKPDVNVSDLPTLGRLSRSIRKLLRSPDGRVRAICLPTSSCPGCLAGRTAVLAGWGVLRPSTTDVPASVQHVQIPIMTNSACRAAYAKDQIGITKNMVCAGFEKGGKDTCQVRSVSGRRSGEASGCWAKGGLISRAIRLHLWYYIKSCQT